MTAPGSGADDGVVITFDLTARSTEVAEPKSRGQNLKPRREELLTLTLIGVNLNGAGVLAPVGMTPT